MDRNEPVSHPSVHPDGLAHPAPPDPYACRWGSQTVHTKSTFDRYRRPSAITLTAMCVLAGGAVALAVPASASASSPLPSAAARYVRPTGPALAHRPSRSRGLRSAVIGHASTATLAANFAQVRAGAEVRFTGTVSYSVDLFGADISVRNQPVALQAQRGSTWDTVATGVLTDAGTVTFTVRPSAARTYRLSFPGTRGLAAASSKGLAVAVFAASPSSSSSGSSYVARGPLAFSSVTTATGRAAQVIALASAQTGKPYVFAAAGPSSFDCSGLTAYVFAQVGVSLPHNADAQKSYGVGVSASAALPGDLVVFLSGSYGYHVGIYAGNGYMYDAPHSGTTVGLHQVYSSSVVFRRLV
jgi:cell wall-associated NlpC family hydrolase